MDVFKQALQHYTKGSSTEIARVFIIVGLIAAGLTYIYLHFFGRHHGDNLWLAYLAPIILFVAGIIFVIVARSIPDTWARLGYAILAIFLLLGAAVSLVVSLILWLLVY